jgi:histidine ammonia-lyase
VGLLKGQLVLGLAVGVGPYLPLSIMTLIVAVRIEARSGAFTAKSTVKLRRSSGTDG